MFVPLFVELHETLLRHTAATFMHFNRDCNSKLQALDGIIVNFKLLLSCLNSLGALNLSYCSLLDGIILMILVAYSHLKF